MHLKPCPLKSIQLRALTSWFAMNWVAKLAGKVVQFQLRGTYWQVYPLLLYQKQWIRPELSNWLSGIFLLKEFDYANFSLVSLAVFLRRGKCCIEQVKSDWAGELIRMPVKVITLDEAIPGRVNYWAVQVFLIFLP